MTDYSNESDGELLKICLRACTLKVEITRNGPEDLMPTIFWWPAALGSKMSMIQVAPLIVSDDESVDVVGILPDVFVDINRRLGPPRMVAYVSEGYYAEGGHDQGMPSERFMRGDPDALECIMIAAARMTGRSDCDSHAGQVGHKTVWIPFCYADGKVQFHEPVDPTELGGVDFGGRVPDALASAFEVGEN